MVVPELGSAAVSETIIRLNGPARMKNRSVICSRHSCCEFLSRTITKGRPL